MRIQFTLPEKYPQKFGLTLKHALKLNALSQVKKLGLLKKSRFLPRNVRQDLYFKVILPSVTYGLILWGSCCNSDLFQSMERLHCRAARLIFNLLKDMASADVLQRAQWPNQPFLSVFISFPQKVTCHINRPDF